jgi:cytochrome c553
MKRRAIQVGCLLAALALFGFLVAASGLVPIRASDGHWRITEWFLKFAMQRSAATHSVGLEVPPLEDRGLIVKGAGHYEFSCRSCHGAPGIASLRVTEAMLPAPTDLRMAVRDSSPKKLFHIVKHGVKFTGMPAFSSQARDDEVWAVVAFLLTLPALDDKGYRELINLDELSAAPAGTVADPEFTRANRSCVQCHGGAGLGRGGTIPRIAGQRADYIRNSLAAYARGSRSSGIMEPIAAGLDAAMIRRLSEHYARLPAKPDAEAKPPGTDEMIRRGRDIAHEGIRGRRVPACIECHDPDGRRANPAYPLLNGQSARYLALQLALFKEGRRGGSSYAHLMESVVAGLEPADMEAVSLYFATRLPSSATATPQDR